MLSRRGMLQWLGGGALTMAGGGRAWGQASARPAITVYKSPT
jgi:hypothetical protein